MAIKNNTEISLKEPFAILDNGDIVFSRNAWFLTKQEAELLLNDLKHKKCYIKTASYYLNNE